MNPIATNPTTKPIWGFTSDIAAFDALEEEAGTADDVDEDDAAGVVVAVDWAEVNDEPPAEVVVTDVKGIVPLMVPLEEDVLFLLTVVLVITAVGDGGIVAGAPPLEMVGIALHLDDEGMG